MVSFRTFSAEDILESAQVMFTSILKLFGEEERWVGRKGAYFQLLDAETGLPLLGVLLGSVPKDKALKYYQISGEKARRLLENQGHVSSWQSRDGVAKWGGAIRFGDYVLSLSGLPELGDEAFCLALAVFANVGGETFTSDTDPAREEMFQKLRAIGRISNNPYSDPAIMFAAVPEGI